MRHALGLRGNTPSRSTADHPVTSANGSQPQRRRFVRDGEVPITVIRRDHQLDGEPGIITDWTPLGRLFDPNKPPSILPPGKGTWEPPPAKLVS